MVEPSGLTVSDRIDRASSPALAGVQVRPPSMLTKAPDPFAARPCGRQAAPPATRIVAPAFGPEGTVVATRATMSAYESGIVASANVCPPSKLTATPGCLPTTTWLGSAGSTNTESAGVVV